MEVQYYAPKSGQFTEKEWIITAGEARPVRSGYLPHYSFLSRLSFPTNDIRNLDKDLWIYEGFKW